MKDHVFSNLATPESLARINIQPELIPVFVSVLKKMDTY